MANADESKNDEVQLALRSDTKVSVWPKEPTRLSDAQRDDLMQDACAGKIYFDWNVPEGTPVESVFIPFKLGSFNDAPRSYVEAIGCVYQRVDKAGPLAVNGEPMFFSMQVLHREDYTWLMKTLKKRLKA